MSSPQRPRLRLIVADDSKAVAQEIVQLLEIEYHVLQVVHDGVALVEAARGLRPDVIVTDLDMPHLNGVQAARMIVDEGLCPAIVVLTVHNYADIADTAAAAGIRGYVLKADAGDELIAAVSCAADGQTYLSRGIRRRRT